MANIDKRVVEMKFDNAAFERGVSTTMSTLDKLKEKLNFSGAAKGLDGLSAAANRVDMSGVGKGVDGLSAKFSALQVAGVTALATIANKAVNAGLQVAKSLTIGPIGQGFSDYNAKLTSVQTIMNATGKDIGTVNGYFKQLDTYSDKTIYNLSDMTGAFAKFTNAGLGMDKSVPAIKGIANMTALAGQGADAASIAMYNLSQSIAGGFLTTTDYKSLNLANVATKEWKQHLIDAAVNAGKLKKAGKGMYILPGAKAATTEQALFTEELSKGWASAEVLTKVLGDYGDTTTAIGKKAQAAAQNVKSLPMMMDTLKASVGTGWTDSFEFILGNVTESTKLFTGMTNAIQGVLDKSSQSRNHMLHQWKDLGGRTAIIESVRNAWQGLGSILKPIGDAFRTVFPSGGAGQALADFSHKLQEITSHMKLGKETADNLKRTFQGVFAIFKIAVSVIGGISKGFFSLFGIMTSGAGGGIASILELTAKIGDFVLGIQQWLDKTGAIQAFFAVLTSPLKLLKPGVDIVIALGDALAHLLTGDVSGFTKGLGGVGDAFKAMFTAIVGNYQHFTQVLSDGLAKIEAFFTGMADKAKNSGNALVAGLASAAAKIAGALSDLTGNASVALSDLIGAITGATTEGQKFLTGFGSGAVNKVIGIISSLGSGLQNLKDKMDFKPVLAAFNRGFGGAETTMSASVSTFTVMSNAISAIVSSIARAFSGITKGLEPVLGALRDFFSTLIQKITGYISGMDGQDAVAVFNTGIMAGLFLVIRNFLGKFGGLLDAFKNIGGSIVKSFDQLTSTLKTMQNSVKANILLKIAGSVAILVAALYVLSKIDAGKLAVSLGALTVMFAQLSGTMVVLTKFADGTSTAKMGAIGFTLLALATAILLLATAVKIMSTMNWQEMLKGLLGIGALLAGLAFFTKMAELDKGGVRAGAGMVLMAVAVNLLAIAMRAIGSMKLGDIIKSAVAIDFLMISLSTAAKRMEGTLKGSAAMLIMATALGILTPVLVTLGLLPYENLAKGLGTVAIGLGLLAIAAKQMTGALPGATAMLAVAGALAILTPSIIAFGLMPISNIAKALVLLAAALTILVIATNAMDTALPGAAALMIVAGALAVLTPVLVVLGQLSWGAIVKGITALALVLAVLVAAVYALTPVIGIMILATKSIALLGAAVMLAGVGFLAFSAALAALSVTGAAGFAVLVAGVVSFLAVLPLIGRQVGYAFVTFALVIAESAPKIVGAFTAVVMAMLKSLQTTVPEFIRTMGIILKALLDEIVKRGPQIFAAGLDLIIGFLKALRSRIGEITNLVIDIFTIFLTTVRNRLPNIIQAGIDLLVAFLNGLATGIRNNRDRINAAGISIATALIQGAISGIGAGLSALADAARRIGQAIVNAVRDFLGIRSPSTVFAGIGGDIVRGLINGITALAGNVGSAAISLAHKVIEGVKTIIGDMAGIGGEIVNGLAHGITNSAHRVMEAAQSLAGKLPGWAKKVLGIASPSKEFIKIGEFVNAGLVEGLTGGSRDKVQAAMEETAKLLGETISNSNSDIEKSTAKLADLTEAQKKNTSARQLAQKELANDQAALNKETAERNTHLAALKAVTAEVDRDKLKIQELTSARYVDAKAVKAAREELAQDEVRLRTLRSARQADLDTIKAKGLEIERDKERLRTLTIAEGDNKAAILATKEAIAQATLERDNATRASAVLQNQLSAETEQLNTLSDEYTDISDKLKTANSDLEAAIKVRDDYKKSISEKYADLPDINKDTTLTDYLTTLQQKVDDTNAFSAAVQKLRDMGLNDASYKELIEKGVDALPFVNKLLEGGQSAVDQVNLIGKNLIDASTTLGAQASAALYDAGVQTAQGLVNGLNSQLAAVQAAMAALAAAMSAKIEAELKIKSPSRVMAQIGVYTVQGLVGGLNNSVPLVETAASNVGNAAVAAMRDAMSRVSDAVDTNMDLVPTITPVLDLSDIRKGAASLDSMMNMKPISVGDSYSRAAEASLMYRANRDAQLVSVDGQSSETPTTQVIFNQTNNSPKALSPADIYRRTNNQLSVVKGALTRNAN